MQLSWWKILLIIIVILLVLTIIFPSQIGFGLGWFFGLIARMIK